jgi:hypothetical protein
VLVPTSALSRVLSPLPLGEHTREDFATPTLPCRHFCG